MRCRSRTGLSPVLFHFALTIAIASLDVAQARAQLVVRSWLPWRTIETRHFAFHYPAELERWTQSIAARADAIDSAVRRVVGFAPASRTHVVVDDPYAISNGSAWPYLDKPVINLWAVPPDPREDIAEFRQWGEMLLSHEFGHIAHLTRPSRNAAFRALWQALPVDLGPIAIRAPRWVVEGYATYIEGVVTGSGRPHGVWRAAFLRQWALEGQLPRYDQLNASGAFAGGEFAYLAGSAFFEWLTARYGDSSLVSIWRRLSARQNRTFDEAFTGVFGESARALYGRFSSELTAQSVAIERALRHAAPPDTGAIVQRLAWGTGDPAISPNGERVAIVLRSPTLPSRVVVWRTATEPDTTRRRRDSLLVARDSADVPARSIYPPPKQAIATLKAGGGPSYESPRFLRDGRIVLWRLTPIGDGTLIPDIYIWNTQTHRTRRITHGSGLKDADPAPSGTWAVATQCRRGWCDLVRVSLDGGDVTMLASGGPDTSYSRPRLSPDGIRVAAARHTRAGWRIVVMDLDAPGRPIRELPPDPSDPRVDVNEYEPSWLNAATLAVTSDASGTPDVESIDIASGRRRRLTSVTGAAIAPEPNRADGNVWFLSLYSRGYDLRRVAGSAGGGLLALGDSTPSAAVPRRSTADVVFATNPVSPPRPFGLGARLFRWIPEVHGDPDGISGGLAFVSSDVIGRSQVLFDFAAGQEAAWRGGRLMGVWRGWRPSLRLALFDAQQLLSESRTRFEVAFPPPPDTRLEGGELAVDDTWAFSTVAFRYRLGGSAAKQWNDVLPPVGPSTVATRSLGFMDGAFTLSQRDQATVSLTLAGNYTVGNSVDKPFQRRTAGATIALSQPGTSAIAASALVGAVNHDAASFEQFSLGGGPSALVDGATMTQRVVAPALPVGVQVGSSVVAYRVSVGLPPFVGYFWDGSTGPMPGGTRTWNRVWGIEWSASFPQIPLAGTPAARLLAGLGESMDAPLRHRVGAYASIVLNP